MSDIADKFFFLGLVKKDRRTSQENLRHTLKKVGEVSHRGYLLSFKIDKYELVVFPQGRVMIKGTTDKSIAKSLFAKYIGL